MKIIIAGDGKVGLALTRQLLHEGHEVTIVDSNPVVLQTNMYQYDVLAVQGNAATMEALRQARVEQADLLIAATSADEINLLCCVTAKKMNSRLHTIARVRNPDYTEQLFVMREELGLSMTINPELSAAREIFHLLQFPSFLHRDSFAKGRVEIVGLRVDEHSRLDGVPLHQLYKIAQGPGVHTRRQLPAEEGRPHLRHRPGGEPGPADQESGHCGAEDPPGAAGGRRPHQLLSGPAPAGRGPEREDH